MDSISMEKILDRINRIFRILLFILIFLKKIRILNPPNGGNELNIQNV